MKKYLALLAFLVFPGLVGAAEVVDTPAGNSNQSINADYGGVDLWISTFSVAVSTVGLPALSSQNPPGTYGNIASTTIASRQRGRIYGAYFSTGSCLSSDYVEVFYSTGGFKDAGWSNNNVGYLNSDRNNGASVRLYNLAGSSFTASGSVCSGFTTLRWPIRTQGTIFIRPSVATYNSVGLLYWLEP